MKKRCILPGHINLTSMEYLANQVWYLIPLLTFLASLTGSLHCLAMCGGFAAIVQNDKSSISLYHLGRLITYLLLGSLAGLTGQLLLQSPFRWLSTVFTIMLSASFIYLGIQIWKQGIYTIQLPKKIVRFFQRKVGRSIKSEHPLAGFFVGFFSGFLPCGWLYTFLLAAVATQNTLIGGIMLLFFWLGTVPILTVSKKILHMAFKRFTPFSRNIGATCLVLAGLSTLFAKITMEYCQH